jgi:hypothetical protein
MAKAAKKGSASRPTIKPKAVAKKCTSKKLQDQEDHSDNVIKSCKRQSRPRNLAEQIRKKVRDNFTGFTDEELTMNPQPDLNVFDRIAADLEAKDSGTPIAMGKAYYAALRVLYRDPNSPIAKLVPKDVTQQVDPIFEAALEALVQTKRSNVEIHQWCSDTMIVNQLMIVALFRQILTMPASKSLENLAVGNSVLEMCVRLDVPTNYPDEWLCVTGHMDALLCRSYTNFKADEETTLEWWESYRHVAKAILPETPTELVLNVEGEWTQVITEVVLVHRSSEIGKLLMKKAMKSIEIEAVGSKVAEHLAQLAKIKHITKEVLEQGKTAFVKTMESISVKPYLGYTPRKEVDIMYLGVVIKMPVLSAVDHWSVAVEAFVRGLGVELELLPRLWCESSLVGTMDPCAAIRVDDSLLVAAKSSRQILKNALADEDVTSEMIVSTVKAKNRFISTTDRYFRIDLGFWMGCTGERAADRVSKLILGCLPTAEVPKTLAESVGLFRDAASNKLLVFAGPSQQSVFKTVRSWIDSMSSGRLPDVGKSGDSTFLATIKTRLALFINDGGAIQGVELLKQRWLGIQTTAPTTPPSYSDLVGVYIFSWLLEKDDKAKLKTMLEASVQAAGTSAAVAGSSSGSGAAASSSSGGEQLAKKSKKDAKSMVRALFMK